MVVDIEREKKKKLYSLYQSFGIIVFDCCYFFFFLTLILIQQKNSRELVLFHFTRPILALLVVCLQGVIYFLYTKRVTFTKIKLY